MKLTKIALAVACLVGSVQAFAAPVTAADITAAQVAGTLKQAWITGASAPTKSVYEGWVGTGTVGTAGCDAGTNAIFSNQAASNTNVTPGSIGNFNAYACTRGGIVSVLYHTVDGGSLNAFTPHTVGTQMARVKFPGTGNGCTASLLYADASDSKNDATIWKGCSLVGTALPSNAIATPATNAANAAALAVDSLGPQLPVGGFSDVEAALFPTAIGGGDVSAVGLDSTANIGQVFGVVVSKPLYRAMQVSQGIAANTDVLDPAYDPANAPNISKQQYTSIISQGGGYQKDWTKLIGATGTGHRVILARRVDTSGSQASSNAFFLANPCASGVLANLNPVALSTTSTAVLPATNGIEVFLGSSTGNVKTRITTASNSTGTDNFAIGVVSAENDWRLESATGGADGYRFIKIDGVHPETGDIANARVTATTAVYPFHMEMHKFVANTAVSGTFEGDVVGQIATALSKPAASACLTLPRGLTISPIAGSVCTVGTQVAKGTNLGKNCAPVVLAK
jgi:hypothetical protein